MEGTMKHFFILAVMTVIGYAIWHFVPKEERDEGVRLFSRHAIRLLGLLLALASLLAIAYYATSTQIL